MKKLKSNSDIPKIPCINCLTLATCKALSKRYVDDINEVNYFFMNLLEYEVCSVLKHYLDNNKNKDKYSRLLIRANKITAVYKYISKDIK